MNKNAIAALIFTLSGPAVAAEPIVLECELPKLVTGRNVEYQRWHGFIEIDQNWRADDYSFYLEGPAESPLGRSRAAVTISRNSGVITVETQRSIPDGKPLQRIGSCKRATKDDNRF
jgi:hypothetical protein